MTTQHDLSPIVLDRHGHPMFQCRDCREPMTHADFFDQGLRLPDSHESAGDYCDAELMDDFQHTACIRAKHSA